LILAYGVYLFIALDYIDITEDLMRNQATVWFTAYFGSQFK